MSKAPFPIQPELTAIAIAYKNRRLIADAVLPRIPVGKAEFKYLKHALADGFTLPNTRVGRKGSPTEVEFSASEVTASTEDFGLDDLIPQSDIDNAPANFDPLGRATEGIMDLVELDREKRVADLVFNANSYATANKETLSGTSQWSDYANSDPVAKIIESLDSMVMRPNIAVFGRATWSKLSMHPKVCKAIFGNNTDAGIVSRQQLASLLELEDIQVGEGWLNTAKKGQAPSMARVWGKHAAFLYRDQVAAQRNGTTFGFTAQFGNRVAGATPDKSIGLRGGQRVRAGESVKEVITANDLGFFLQNAVA